MLQQTRVETVIPYYTRWMERFPNDCCPGQVPCSRSTGAWEGLGYYSRARNLHRAAQLVVQPVRRKLPRDVQRAAPAAGHWPLHSRRYRFHRLRTG